MKPIDEFVSYFCEKLEKLITHDHIKTQQSTYIREAKNNLKDGEVQSSFLENRSANRLVKE